jgi:hypothetical protein
MAPPPLVRDQMLDLAMLRRLALEYDAISREDGQHWPAVRFVDWLTDESRAVLAAEGKPRDLAA